MNHFRSVWSFVTILALFSCSKKEEDTLNANTKMRSTGSKDFSLLANLFSKAGSKKSLQLNGSSTMIGNSAVKIDSFKVPVSRVNLVSGLSGTGYSEASPSLYNCPYTTDDECLVDLMQPISIDNLLKGAAITEVTAAEAKTYNGVAVEFCHQFSSQNVGQDNSYYELRFKGSVKLGSATYYTNATSGLSATAPAEEVKVKARYSGCGVTTHLLEPVTMEAGKDIDLVLYADPNGAVFATNYKTLANSACIGEESLAICSDPVSVFGTVDAAAPSIERYQLVTSGTYTDLLMTLVFNSSSKPFGGYLRHFYTNAEEAKTLHGNMSFTSIGINADSSLKFEGYDKTGSKITFISSFPRASSSTVSTLTQYVDAPVEYTVTKL